MTKKKIDPQAFKLGEPELWAEFEHIFNQVHPDSFTAQKLYLINPIRRQYPLKDEQPDVKQESVASLAAKKVGGTAKPKPAMPKPGKPKLKPKPKIN